MPKQNRVRIYAGPNGSGKSSLYKVISKEYLSGIFVNADDFEKNIERVKNRVLKDGHNVHEEKIKSRYFKTLENLADAIRSVHRAYIFDNSGNQYELIAEIYQGNAFKFHSSSIPEWFEKYVYNKFKF
jgi:predicted ABC-type ATPase